EAQNGQEALDVLHREPVDLAILDVMMPYRDGFEVTQWIRQRSNIPIIILTALGNTDDVVRGFSLGADDYITKPFTFKELRARLEAILRRMQWAEEPPRKPLIRQGDIVLDPGAQQAVVRGEVIPLTPIETELLYYLMSHPNEAIRKGDLFREVWGYDFVGSGNLVEVSIRRLREKIEPDPCRPRHIQTVRGVGYKFVPSA
ncbi:MAG: response regulator transcription factor, partial [Anaerolineae bacterium]|nr:response regulator transcription factor [Anaerolineae bacterium]